MLRGGHKSIRRGPRIAPPPSPPSIPPPPPDLRPWREQLFEFHPPEITRKDEEAEPLPSYPLHLFDRHLSADLILKHVVVLPNLHIDLCESLDRYSTQMDSIDQDLLGLRVRDYYENTGADAISISKLRERGVAYPARSIASGLLMHPKQPNVSPMLAPVNILASLRPTLLHDRYATQSYTMEISPPAESRVFPSYDRKSMAVVKRLLAAMPYVSAGMTFCTDASPLMESMDTLATQDIFPWRFDSEGRLNQPASKGKINRPPDAPSSLWVLPDWKAPRRSARLKAQTREFEAGPAVPIAHAPWMDTPYIPSPADYVQKVSLDKLSCRLF